MAISPLRRLAWLENGFQPYHFLTIGKPIPDDSTKYLITPTYKVRYAQRRLRLHRRNPRDAMQPFLSDSLVKARTCCAPRQMQTQSKAKRPSTRLDWPKIESTSYTWNQQRQNPCHQVRCQMSFPSTLRNVDLAVCMLNQIRDILSLITWMHWLDRYSPRSTDCPTVRCGCARANIAKSGNIGFCRVGTHFFASQRVLRDAFATSA